MKFYILLTIIWGFTWAHDSGQNPNSAKSRSSQPLSEEQTTEFWMKKAQNILAQKLQKVNSPNTNKAKNIILFLGDGMSVHTVTATRNLMGDSNKQLSFEKFPYLGLSRTYAVNKRTPDSACSGTAYLSGVKANYGTIGVNAQVSKEDCLKASNVTTHTESLAKWAQEAGKWAGFVTTARVTHASPAGVYAHSADRGWESNQDIIKSGCSPDINVDIARQLVEWPVGKDLHVIMGGGRRNFRDKSVKDEEGYRGCRTDQIDLIQEWLDKKNLENKSAEYVWSKNGLDTVNINQTDYLLGLFCSSHCPYHGDLKRNNLEYDVPSLSYMTETAINLLSRNDKGYFLFVEGAKIDIAHHGNRARVALEETEEFSKAIELSREMTSEKDTLIIVTSDHSHTMTINGYPDRQENIFGLAPNLAADDLPYTILSYANGPGYSKTYSSKKGRRNLFKARLTNPQYRYMATVPLSSETHGSDDVGVFASGPYEHFFTGNYEQSNIPALIANIANFGPFADEKL